VASVVGWAGGATPVAAPGLKANAFATGLKHPRQLILLPNGDVLASEPGAPAQPDEFKGVRGKIQGFLMSRAGSKNPSGNDIVLLRDADGDGVAETRSVLLSGLNSAFGMALVGDQLYVAATDKLLRYPFKPGDMTITAKPVVVTALPAGTRNHHWSKNVIASPDGSKLYVSIGSNSNVGENGLAAEQERAAIWEVDAKTGEHRIFAGGLRNPNGMAWNPVTRELWAVVNERDELGSDLVPDYLTSVQFGGFYGWPWSYWGGIPDSRAPEDGGPGQFDTINRPDYGLGAHTAALGLSFATGQALGPRFAEGAFIGLHGSWNRKPPSGYKVIFVPFRNGAPAGMPIDVLTGFLNKDGDAQGRPVGVVIDAKGALLVADDAGDRIWRVTAK
jgi:glucose/arabinose dehydrogenase